MIDPKLKSEFEKTLRTPRMKYSFLARILFLGMDIAYGKKRRFQKFRLLELLARIPYQVWEDAGYRKIEHYHKNHEKGRKLFDELLESRNQQDNEQFHFFILEELMQKKNIKENFIYEKLLPPLAIFPYLVFSGILYWLRSKASFQLNAEFEDHAEHEYMELVRENPEFENEPFESKYEKDYGSFKNLAELFIQIGLDERRHKEESLRRINKPVQ